ncbi:MAG: hypothetical protein LBU94_00215, partial [Clostridiales bacterium]|nr:hypothetical protein [Clostridiales bacterium]
ADNPEPTDATVEDKSNEDDLLPVEAEDNINVPTENAENNNNIVQIDIPAGYNTENIAKMLYDNGLVDDAQAFNQFIIDNNLSRSLIADSYAIEKGLTYSELLNIISKGS